MDDSEINNHYFKRMHKQGCQNTIEMPLKLFGKHFKTCKRFSDTVKFII